MEKNQAMLGAPATKQCEAVRESEVQQHQQTLGCSLEELANRVQNLENRLEPVLRYPQPIKEGLCDEVEQELVPIANTVRLHNNTAVSLIHKVKDIIDRLEI